MDKKIVSEIWIYPVKSLGGIRLTQAVVLPKGLQHDRRWMLIDANNSFMTQRVYPAMALFKLSWEEEQFSIHHGNDTIDLPFTSQGEPLQAVIWDDKVEVYEVSARHSKWFSEKLGRHCKLVVFPEQNERRIDPEYAVAADQVSLADAYPLLIIGQGSLDDLNSRTKKSLPMNRFRPNIVFTGGKAYDEDNWRNFRIGNGSFAAVKPCSRCVLTTVDQDTAEKGSEPLVTLASYRRRSNNVYFGQNLIVNIAGTIREGDEIILE